MALRFTGDDFRKAVDSSRSGAEVLRKLGLRPAGGNFRALGRYAERFDVSLFHLDLDPREHTQARRSLDDVLVEHSTYHPGHLKDRLYAEGLRERRCVLCGQGEEWNGRRMALILDHINGVGDDHRLDNLRIVCPNCAATLDTHCGRNQPRRPERQCLRCAASFQPRWESHRYCSRACGSRWDRSSQRLPRPERRKVERPSYERLMAELAVTSYLAVGRRYGVSDNAVRKWVRAYERAEEAA